MSSDALKTLLETEGTAPRADLLSRWTGYSVADDWESEPDYGEFVDDQGRAVLGAGEPEGWLVSDDPRSLRLVTSREARIPAGSVVAFLDWGRQPLAWEELFELWDAWEAQGMVWACGPAAVPAGHSGRWVAPGWVVFQPGFDGAPLALVPWARTAVMASEPTTVAPTAAQSALAGTLEAGESFLSRARKLRGEAAPTVTVATAASPQAPEDPRERLPLLPFTLGSLNDPAHRWPVGAA